MRWNILETMFERIFRYLLKRYFGQYLEDFSLEQLSYGLSHGKGSVENVRLNVEALNELSEIYNLPVEFLSGSIDNVSILVPWAALLSENTVIELRGLRLIVQPKERPEDVSMFDSMWGSTTSSLQLAEDCLNSKAEDDEEFDVSDRSEGLENMARTIDAVLSNMKVIFRDSSLKIEHLPDMGPCGVALEIKIGLAEYFDEAGVRTPLSDDISGGERTTYEPHAYSFKKVVFEGVSLFTAQFSPHMRTRIPSSSNYMDPTRFVPGSPEMPPTHPSLLPSMKSEPSFEYDPILISKLTGRQELRLKLKQNEAIIGPKVDVEFNFGAFNLFLIPQQVHMLYELLRGLMKPSSSNGGSNKMHLGVTNKPMKPADYALVEQELLRNQQRFDFPTKSLRNQPGWSSHSLEESYEDFQSIPHETQHGSEFQNPTLNDNDSMCSSFSSDTRSDISGNVFANNQRPSRVRGSTVQAMLQDQLSELTHFRGCCSSLCIVILHDDSVQESINKNSSDDSKSNSNKLSSLKDRAETFFNGLAELQMSGIDFKNFATMREPLSGLCDTNHLRLLASSVSIDGNEKSSSSQCIIKFSLSLYQFEVLECLFNSANLSGKPQGTTYVEMLLCDNKVKTDESNIALKEACFKLNYQKVEYTTQSRHIKPPSNKLEIQFGILTCELDISLTDRIQTLLNFRNSPVQVDAKNDWIGPDVTAARSSPKTEVTISSPNLKINLRFPIPDLRSIHDMDRVPWWQQNLQPEILILDAKDVTFLTTLEGDNLQAQYEIQCKDLHGFLKLPEEDDPIAFLRVSVDPDVDEVSKNSGFDWPRLVIHKTTKPAGGDLEPLVDHEEMFTYSLSDVLMSNIDTEPSPFQSTSVAYASKLENKNNIPGKEENGHSSSEHDEVIKPADKETILNFMEQTVNKSELLFKFSLPTVNIVLPSKDFYEMLMNRLSKDLMMWKKTILASKTSYDSSDFKVHIPGLDFSNHLPKEPVFDSFSGFKPFPNDSNSDSDEEEANFCSVYEYCQKERQKQKKINANSAFTKLTITVSITKGNLTIHGPALDASNVLLPDVCGKLQLFVEDAQIFQASSYRGDENEAYMCVLANKSTLYHDATALKPPKFQVIPALKGGRPSDINCIIYKSESGMCLKSFACDTSKFNDMLKIAVHIVRNPKLLLKSFKVAIDISDATLRHYTHSMSQLWVIQFLAFLKLADYHVNGFIPTAIVTEFHLNLSNCAIDYRPLNLPLLSALTVENFNMSCNISATTPTFLFRIISEEMRLFVSNNLSAKKVNLRNNYVCVIDSGLIDVSFRTTTDEKNIKKKDLTITNNIIHIRSCADSFKALIDLIIYFTSNGDMMDNSDVENTVAIKEEMCVTKKTDSDNLHLEMAEAMKDCSLGIKREEATSENRISDYDRILNTDDEFCILDDDPGVGLKPRNGEPQIRMLTDKPIIIVDNYFSVPPGVSDLLKAPKHFPKPLFLFTLREMSLVWHLYGGNDFNTVGKNKGAKNKEKEVSVTFADTKKVDMDTNNSSVSFCKVTPLTQNLDVKVLKYSMEQVTLDQNREINPDMWFHHGGKGRNLDVLMELQMNKIKFQRELYPLQNEYASRYIMLIHDIEIRDRLKSSSINKFLYQYSSQKVPRQSHAYMIEVKAVNTRPDPNHSSEECSLHVSCKPLRLNVDQDSLIFLIGFFREVIGITLDESGETNGRGGDEKNTLRNSRQVKSRSNSVKSETFYRVFTFSPDVLIRMDYQGKHILMEQGALKGLLFGLGQLNSSEINLKRLCYRHGLLGHHKLLSYATNEWQQDILKNQLPSILGGVGPMRSFVQLFQGVKDFFYLPVAQYQKDGQIVRGLQRGASSFSTSALMATLDLFSGLISAIQSAAIVGCDMVSPGPSVANRYQRSQETHRQTSQPADIREGLATALNVVKEGLGDTAWTLYSVAYAEHEHKGVPGAVGGVLRQIPPCLFKPIILGSEATNSVLGGVRHQLMPDAHQEDMHKWRTKNS